MTSDPPMLSAPGPRFVVGSRHLAPVATIDEAHGNGQRPPPGDLGRLGDECAHDIAHTGTRDGAAELGQRIEASVRIDELGIVPFPPRLVLLRTAVMIDRVHDDSRLARNVGQPQRRAPAVSTDFYD